jgi:hypothetical protein
MLFHASAENKEFVCATQIPTNSPNAAAAVKPAPTSCKSPRTVQKSLKFSAPAPRFNPMMIPSTINANSAPVFAVVKTFWISLPTSNPRVFVNVRNPISARPTNCAVESDNAYPPNRIGAIM